jgi:hypothetical protein
MSRFNCGKDALTTAINSLQENNYLFIAQARADDGKFTKSIWYLSDQGKAKEQAEQPEAEKPYAEKSDAEKQPLIIYNNTNTDNTNTDNTNTDNNIYIGKIDKCKNFKKPSIEELTDFCEENRLNIDPRHFIDFYNSNGWKVGKNSMKDWKATARNWHRTANKFSKQNNYQAINKADIKKQQSDAMFDSIKKQFNL